MLGTVLAGVAGEKKADDRQALQGTWQAVDIQANGHRSPDDQIQELKVVFEGDTLYAVKGQSADPRHRFKLDVSKDIKTIDISPLDNPAPERRGPGIYALDKGQLKVCVNLFGKDPKVRPTTFQTHEGDGIIFATFERVKP